MALDEQMTKMLQRDIKDAETRSRKEITQEQIDAGKTAAGLVADMTPFVGGVKGAIEAPEDLEYAKNLMAQGYKEKDLKKMGLGGAFTVLTGLGFLPGAKIATDVTKSAIKSSVKKQTDNLITPKRQAQIDYAKTLEKGERRKFLKDVNRPVPKVFHGALNMSDNIQEDAKYIYSKTLDDYNKTLDQQDVRIADLFLDESKYKKPKQIKKKDGLTVGELNSINEKNRKAIQAAKQKAQKSHIEPEVLENSSGQVVGVKVGGSGDSYYSEYVDFNFVRSKDGKSIEIYDASSDSYESPLVDTIPITDKGIARKDLTNAIDKYNSKMFDESAFSKFEVPAYKTKAEQLEMEGFAPYNKRKTSTNARRRPFEGDKSMFGSSQTGEHLEMKGVKALSTSRDPLVSSKHGFANRVLANIVYADLPKSVKRDLSPEEYSILADRGNYFYSVDDQNELRQRMINLDSPLSLPKSQHLESEIAIQRPEDLKVKRLSDDTTQVGLTAKPGPTRATGKLPLSARVREGQQLVNRLFKQEEEVLKYSALDLEKPVNAKKVYQQVRSMFKDAQSLAKYTEQYGARGTYDSYIETLSQDPLFINKLELAAQTLPQGEQKKNLVVLADLLNNMPDNTGRQEALARAKTETRGLSDKELLNIMYDRPNLVPSKEYDIPGLSKEVELLDVLPEMGYNDKKRMLFLATQKLNRGGLVQMEKGGVVPMKSMDQQMELFADGGLMDEGGMVDEESGNEVPSGSLREEVRDDIPAQLSEGEFVFPADVVRYYGLEKLMQMRQEAKAGLARMEAMGQMGNADEATLPDDLPFTIDDLDMEDEEEYNNRQEFAVGGLAAPLQNTMFIPTGQPMGTVGQAQAPMQAASAAAPVQAASAQPIQPGTTQLPGTKFTPTTVQAVTPTFQETIGAGVIGVDYEMVDYVNEAGQVIQLRKSKSTGEMLDPIPEGYTLKSETPVTTTPTTVESATTRDDGGNDGPDKNTEATISFGGTKATGKRAGLVDNAFRANIAYTGFSPMETYGFMGKGISSFANSLTGGKVGEPLTLSGKQGVVISNIVDPRTKKGFGQAQTLDFSIALNANQYNSLVSRAGVDKVTSRKELADITTQLSKINDSLAGETLDYGRAKYLAESIKMGRQDEIEDSIAQGKGLDKAIADALGRDRGKVEGSGIFGTNIGARDRTGAVSAAERAAMSAQEKAAVDAAMTAYAESMSTEEPDDYDSGRDNGRDDGGFDGSEGFGRGDDAAAPLCLTEDMKVKLNGVVDFVTNVEVGDIVDNTVVTEVLHKHMREGYYGVNGELKITNDHPVLANGSWKRTEDLVLGDYINSVEVTSLEYVEQVTPTVYIGTADDRYDVYTEGEVYTVHGQYKNGIKKAA